MKLFTSAFLISLATLAGTASAANNCIVEVRVNGFLDGKTCNIPVGKTVEVLTGYTQCEIPVLLDKDCKIIDIDLSRCPVDNIKTDSFAGKCY